MEIASDVTTRVLQQAMSGLALRQRTIADNLANIETPGFLAGKVDFESALRTAVANGENPLATQVATARSLEPTRVNGSNVNIDEETLAGQQTVLSTQVITLALTNKFNGLRTSITGQ
ncbi:flagellar basal-body rod protein FlgB [Kineosphaera limosa]|uniref:Putative flagellar basal-body rod protein FlgB n=1 Tax=Kineosphaera limosa NBRC 100340 TaxID=1184609 RepID=K6WFP1_9MICO|nr:flagellar basal body protein [Kineosphaera limosa]NYD99827.1 flagellar basal-body rod protein FlgB [Kineosphaera limosa]GAB98115.1 putative flagellar basal-body rod protein FlgB [Kineosphaera limosa NBRC 100340]